MKEIKRIVDDHLPKWLNSKILSAVGYVHEINKETNMELSIKRIKEVSGHLELSEMKYVMALLCLDKVVEIVEHSKDFDMWQEKRKERTMH